MKEIAKVEQTADSIHVIEFADGTYMTANARSVKIGKRTLISRNLQIGLPDKPVDQFIVGDGCRLFAGIIAPRNFVCGDYVTIHKGVWAYGRNNIVIGHNAWFGMRCTLDAEGGFRVGNGFGAGQDTHLWSHIRHGDISMGCQYLSFGQFEAGDDVWFVGRCTSSPAYHSPFSVALTESNVTKGMEYNHVYGGNPAKDLTDRIGSPYKFPEMEERAKIFHRKMQDFPMIDKLKAEDLDKFNPKERTYEKDGTFLQHSIMRFLLPEIKFVPQNKESVVFLDN